MAPCAGSILASQLLQLHKQRHRVILCLVCCFARRNQQKEAAGSVGLLPLEIEQPRRRLPCKAAAVPFCHELAGNWEPQKSVRRLQQSGRTGEFALKQRPDDGHCVIGQPWRHRDS